MSYDDSQLYIPTLDPKVQEKFSHCGTVRSKIIPFCMIQPKVVFCVLAVDLLTPAIFVSLCIWYFF